MNLDNFETYISDTILGRGLAYFEDRHVLSLEPNGDTWIATVAGSDDYTVGVTISDNGEIVDSVCSCPYNWSDFCKHLVAVFYTLREEFTPEVVSARIAEKERLERILNRLDKEALASIVLEFANKDRHMRETLLLRYAEPADLLQAVRGAIRGAIKAVTRRGFVEYQDVPRAMVGLDMVLPIIYEKAEANDKATVLSLCMIVLEEMIALLSRCDDSDGLVDGVIRDTLDSVEATLGPAPGYDHAAIQNQLEHYIAERRGVPGCEEQHLQELQYLILDRLDETL